MDDPGTEHGEGNRRQLTGEEEEGREKGRGQDGPQKG